VTVRATDLAPDQDIPVRVRAEAFFSRISRPARVAGGPPRDGGHNSVIAHPSDPTNSSVQAFAFERVTCRWPSGRWQRVVDPPGGGPVVGSNPTLYARRSRGGVRPSPPRCQRGDHGFESRQDRCVGALGWAGRAPASQAGRRGFDSHRPYPPPWRGRGLRSRGSVVRLHPGESTGTWPNRVRLQLCKLRIVGSSPTVSIRPR
jgi:hypothetical protein